MKNIAVLFATTVLSSSLAFSDDYNLSKLAQNGKINVFNRKLDQTEASAPGSLYLSFAEEYGVAWITGVEFSQGTVEVEVKGKDKPGQSFIGIAFHGRNNEVSMLYTCDPSISEPQKQNTEPTPFNTSPCPGTTGTNCERITLASMKRH